MDRRTADVLVVEPDPSCPLDRFAGWFAEDGLRTTVVRPYAGEPVPAQLTTDGLVVLGGDMSSLDDAGYAWLADVRTLLLDAVVRRRPTLGICLGAQLLAQAAGGTVAVGREGPEAGLVRVAWRPEAADDPLVGGLASPLSSATMHGDAVTVLPEGAAWLGSTTAYPVQVFRVGTAAWGLQFHPEVSPALYRDWVTGLDPRDAATPRAVQGVPEVEDRDAEVAGHTRALARRFATLVHQAGPVETPSRGGGSGSLSGRG